MIEELNRLGACSEPFLFVIDYEKKFPLLFTKDKLKDVKFCFDGNYSTNSKIFPQPKIVSKTHISQDEYTSKFDEVLEQIRSGNTYILNLTAPTSIEIHGDLESIYESARAQFKLLVPGSFVVFSPERFVKIEHNKIKTYPMKGTCNADEISLELLLASPKEHAEHTMVVDLLRNDLSIVSKNVKVDSFREFIRISAGDGELYQTISTISGDLEDDWRSKIGDILYSLLPAGSITGTPKKKTVELIKSIENYDRGYFTGIFGYFDGSSFDSAVMIRYIEKTPDGYVYKSGGGITLDSSLESEYEEMIAKVYIPCV